MFVLKTTTKIIRQRKGTAAFHFPITHYQEGIREGQKHLLTFSRCCLLAIVLGVPSIKYQSFLSRILKNLLKFLFSHELSIVKNKIGYGTVIITTFMHFII